MTKQNIYEKLKILADSAKYDVSCSSSGVGRKSNGKRGSAAEEGICHTWSADGRCVSLLKILFTNRCVYDCEYCVNRRTSSVERASFEPEELATLTMEFYRRNYIEGLFLSSAVEVSPDYTAERILKSLLLLRNEHNFGGYIHAKIIPGVSQELLHEIGLVADRLSVNVELPSEESLKLLAPQKKKAGIFTPMKQITNTLAERGALKGPGTMYKGQDIRFEDTSSALKKVQELQGVSPILDDKGYPLVNSNGTLMVKETRQLYKVKFAPAGQTTQMIIGASPETDQQIMKVSEGLYRTFKMKRVYYSAYIPVSGSELLPGRMTLPPLTREHRIYQADWLLRFYGFTADEILDDKNPFLDLDLDPKISWALRNIERFPVEINKASLDELLRIPGVGAVSALRIVRQRRLASVKFEDLKKIGVVLKRARYFITCSGKYYGGEDLIPQYIKNQVLEEEKIKKSLLQINDEVQISMFDAMGQNVLTGKEKDDRLYLR